MTGVELTRRVPCATCGGTKKVDQLRVSRTKLFHVAQIPCSKCRGTDGTVRVAVSCASCVWYLGDDDGICVVRNVENLIEVEATFGCLMWAAKEGTDGND